MSGENGPGLGVGSEAHVTGELGRTPESSDGGDGGRSARDDGDGFDDGGHREVKLKES